MTPERYEQIGRLYHAALEGEPAERDAFLAGACGSDVTLRLEVESLISAHEHADVFIEQPPDDVAAGWQVAATPLPEHSFAHFRLHSLLGKGGMGEVWLAEDTKLSRKVAIKLLPAEFTSDAGRVRRFAQEARAASALNHPNIITIYEIGKASAEGGGRHYIVAEYVEGETLRQRMTGASQPRVSLAEAPAEAIRIAAQIAAALAAAHEAGILHRDIKPENVMVRRDGLVKVLDFGLAKLAEAAPPVPSFLVDSQASMLVRNSTDSGLVMGTPRYMSPEQARGEKMDARTDIFSLGVMLYEMVAGCAPFTGATTGEMIASILRDEPSLLSRIAPATPPELEVIVGRALCKSREERYQTANDLLADLKQLQRDLEFASEGRKRSGARGMETVAVPNRQGGPDSSSARSTYNPVAIAAASVPHSRRAAIIALAIILPIAAAGAWFYFHRRHALTSKDTILLADFDNRTGDEIFDPTLKQGLAIQLQQSPFLNLFPEARVRQTLRLMKRTAESRVTAEVAREICERENLKAYIAGSIAPLGSHYVITFEAINAQSGESLAHQQVEAESYEQVMGALSQAATRLRGELGESLSSIQRFDKPLQQVTTSKLEALRDYSLSFQQAINGNLTEAVSFMKRAVEIDPNFAGAYNQLAIYYYATARPEAAGECAKKTYALKDQASEHEQPMIAYRYYLLGTGDVNKAVEMARLIKQTPENEFNGAMNLTLANNFIGQYDQAIAEARDAIRLRPKFAPAYWNLTTALLRVNRFAEVNDAYKQALGQQLDPANIHIVLYQIAFINGDAAGMQQQLDWMRGKPDEYAAFDWQAGGAAFTGQWRKAQGYSRRAIDLAARGDAKEVAARYATERALRSAIFGDCRAAKTDVAQGLMFARGRTSLPRATLALAMCGETNQAKPMLAELSRLYPEDTLINSIWLPMIRGATDLQHGDATRAVERLQATLPYEAAAEFWPQYLRGQAYLKLRRGTEAAAEFQKILDHRGYAPLSPLYPMAHLGLARASLLLGDATKAHRSYQDFFVLWEEADSNLLPLIAARQEYERLK
jgi:serine/threonine protein kinase/Flp pilus assembly protein TadD